MKAARAISLGVALAACGPPRVDGLTRLSLGQTLALAPGPQRVLLPLPGGKPARVLLVPPPGDFATMSVSSCQLDPHLRIDEGDHCLGQAVESLADGSSEADVQPPSARFNGVAVRVDSVGSSAGPVRLTMVSAEAPPPGLPALQ